MKRLLVTATALVALIASSLPASAEPVTFGAYTFDLPAVSVVNGVCQRFTVKLTRADGLPLRMSAQAKVVDSLQAGLGVAFLGEVATSGQTTISAGSIGCDGGEYVGPFTWSIVIFEPNQIPKSYSQPAQVTITNATPTPTPTPTPTASASPADAALIAALQAELATLKTAQASLSSAFASLKAQYAALQGRAAKTAAKLKKVCAAKPKPRGC